MHQIRWAQANEKGVRQVWQVDMFRPLPEQCRLNKLQGLVIGKATELHRVQTHQVARLSTEP